MPARAARATCSGSAVTLVLCMSMLQNGLFQHSVPALVCAACCAAVLLLQLLCPSPGQQHIRTGAAAVQAAQGLGPGAALRDAAANASLWCTGAEQPTVGTGNTADPAWGCVAVCV
jgi:hypothetical protein